MLAIARALVLNPRILLLDEPTEGLAPMIAVEVLQTLARLFREEGMAGIVVEQHAQKILPITDFAVILERGSIVHAAPSRELAADNATLEHFSRCDQAQWQDPHGDKINDSPGGFARPASRSRP